MKIVLSLRRHHYVKRLGIFLVAVALIVGMTGCGATTPAIEIKDWYGLDAVRGNMTQNYVLINDLDSTTAGYEELASPTANGGKGWDPIGGHEVGAAFQGNFDGNGHKICDLFINRPDERDVGLFGTVGAVLFLTGSSKMSAW